jgi:hypothetical protein
MPASGYALSIVRILNGVFVLCTRQLSILSRDPHACMWVRAINRKDIEWHVRRVYPVVTRF